MNPRRRIILNFAQHDDKDGVQDFESFRHFFRIMSSSLLNILVQKDSSNC
jgi:hypothetical protein